tara:strand:- start:45757 stop:47631 length:1875 start_codon:yes stop_codon:yes gene_type:complete
MATPRYPEKKMGLLDDILEEEIRIANMPRILEIQNKYKQRMMDYSHDLSEQDKELEDYRKILDKSIEDRQIETSRLLTIKENKQKTYQDKFGEFFDPTTLDSYDKSSGNVEDIDDDYLDNLGLLINQFSDSENAIYNDRLKSIINEENELRVESKTIDKRISDLSRIKDQYDTVLAPDLVTSDRRETLPAEEVTDYSGNVLEAFDQKDFDFYSRKDVQEAVNRSVGYFNEDQEKINGNNPTSWEWDSEQDYKSNYKNLQPWQKAALSSIITGQRQLDEMNDKVLDNIYKETQMREGRILHSKTASTVSQENKVKARDQILSYLVNDNAVYGSMSNNSTPEMSAWVIHDRNTDARMANQEQYDKEHARLTAAIQDHPWVKASGNYQQFYDVWKRIESHPEVFIKQVWEPSLRIYEGYKETEKILKDKVKAHNEKITIEAKRTYNSSSKKGKAVRGKYSSWRQYLQAHPDYIYSTPGVHDDENAMNLKDMILSSKNAYLEKASDQMGVAINWNSKDMALIAHYFTMSSTNPKADVYQQPLFINAQELLNVRESMGVSPDDVLFKSGWRGESVTKSVVDPSLKILNNMNIDDIIKDTRSRKSKKQASLDKERLQHDMENYDYYIGAS